ncbi:MAG: hypothetical protein B7C24_04065, partial [Bacteroidetes bacterium 4572_77]
KFTAIENNCSADIIITQGNEYSIRVIAPEKYLDNIITKISSETLYVDIKGNIFNADELRVEVTVVKLTEISSHSSGDFEIKGILEGETLDLDMHGSGDFEGQLNIKDMDIDMHGSGDVELSGVNGNLSVVQQGSGDFEGEGLHLGNAYFKMNGSGDNEVSGTAAMMELKQNGSGDFDGRSFEVKTAKIRKTSSGEADVFITEMLDASISGSGDLNIKGRPEISNLNATGSGDIRNL